MLGLSGTSEKNLTVSNIYVGGLFICFSRPKKTTQKSYFKLIEEETSTRTFTKIPFNHRFILERCLAREYVNPGKCSCLAMV